MTDKKPLCGNCSNGWIETEDGELVGRCPCRSTLPTTTAQAERDAALTATAEANPNALTAALRIIEDAAKAEPIVSSNTLRGRFNIAQIPGPVRGMAFRTAMQRGYIRTAGTEASTDQGTHAHHVRIYESRIFAGVRSA